MNKLTGTMVIVVLGAGLAFADTAPPAAAAAPPKGASVSQQVQQLERDWSDALKAGDIDKIGQIVADDWTGIGYDGNTATKKSFLADVKAGKDKAESVEIGPMDVKVLGSVAIVQGSDIEKSITDGKETSGKWVWMDVFVKRDGKWLAVRSQSAWIR